MLGTGQKITGKCQQEVIMKKLCIWSFYCVCTANGMGYYVIPYERLNYKSKWDKFTFVHHPQLTKDKIELQATPNIFIKISSIRS